MPEEDGQLQVQVQFGGPIQLGHVVVVLLNCPIEPYGDSLLPAFKMKAREAMELGMNLIHMAKWAEQQELTTRQQFPIADSEVDRCGELTKDGQCILKRGHECRHLVHGV